MNDPKFNFFVPLDEAVIEKAAQAPLADRYKNMVLEGRASDDKKDIEEEILEPSGYEIEHFLKGGYINYEHLAKKSPKFLIGEPVSATIKDNQFFIKAKLWEKSAVARDTWDKILEMKASGTKRRPGWSIEGKALARDPHNPKRITRALITNVALTFNPVNFNTFADIAKGLQKQDFVEVEYDTDDDQREFLFEFKDGDKTLRVGKDYNIFTVVKKSMDVAATKPLVPESLHKPVKNITQPTQILKSIAHISKFDVLMRDPNIKERIFKIIRQNR